MDDTFKNVEYDKMVLFKAFQELLELKEEFENTLAEVRQVVVSIAQEHDKLAPCYIEKLGKKAEYAGAEHYKDFFSYVETMYKDEMKKEGEVSEEVYKEIDILSYQYDHSGSFAKVMLSDLNRDLKAIHDKKCQTVKRMGLKRHFEIVQVLEIAETDDKTVKPSHQSYPKPK